MEYAASSFANLSKKALSKLKICDNKILRKCLGLIKSTPTHIIHHMAAELPGEYRFQLATAKEISKLIAYNLPLADSLINQPLTYSTSYTMIFTEFEPMFREIEKLPSSTTNSKIKVDIDFFKNITKSKKEANEEQIYQLFNKKLNDLKDRNIETIFTDGSVKEDSTKAAFYHNKSNTIRSFHTNKRMASMTAELIAFIKAIDFAITHQINRLAILTDSKSGVMALTNEDSNNYLTIEIRNKIQNSNLEIVEFPFIPNHSGIHQNNIVDNAAKNADRNGEFIHLGWTIDDACKEIERILTIKWQRHYSIISNDKGKKYYQMFPKISKHPWFKFLNNKIEANLIKQMNRTLTGHAFRNETLAKFNIIQSSNCETCQVDETPEHIIFKCTKFNTTRNLFTKIQEASSIQEFYKNNQKTFYYTIINFLKQIKAQI
ncbi:uncharacterized protein LOC128924119 [Zeugodacus cucurbitae]|uniref:uncharacterized protein LOC128924119 n=1 Tax=Zeugodacus cucurbitae TaxID=28588 RepID=UPI0023D91F96|nr:uncharacterized protein LOC128924119 [Zeugodacus cucurbitae]